MVAAAQAAPLLLRRFFALVTAQAPPPLLAQLAPALLERVDTLYPAEPFAGAVREVCARLYVYAFARGYREWLALVPPAGPGDGA